MATGLNCSDRIISLVHATFHHPPAFFLCHIGFFSCNKPGDGEETDPFVTENDIPPAATLSTAISVYLHTPNPASFSSILVNNELAPYANGIHSTNNALPSDKYRSYADGINGLPGPAVSCVRYFPVTSSIRNYVDVNRIKHEIVGVVQNVSTSCDLPEGGQLTYGTNSFVTGDVVFFTYINPVKSKYALSLPETTADKNGKRWWLRSFGAFFISLPEYNPGGDPVFMTYPIPAQLLSEAPDSVQAWYFENEKWVDKGFAKKTGNSYQAILHKEGIWNFAIPIKGLYKQVKFHTSNAVPVTNAILRITSGPREVATARTDANGNAFCFLPVNEQLVAEVLPFWVNAPTQLPLYTMPISPFTNSQDIMLSVDASSLGITTVKGTFKNCNGSNVSSGEVRWFQASTGFLKSVVPVTDGTFSFAMTVIAQ